MLFCFPIQRMLNRLFYIFLRNGNVLFHGRTRTVRGRRQVRHIFFGRTTMAFDFQWNESMKDKIYKDLFFIIFILVSFVFFLYATVSGVMELRNISQVLAEGSLEMGSLQRAGGDGDSGEVGGAEGSASVDSFTEKALQSAWIQLGSGFFFGVLGCFLFCCWMLTLEKKRHGNISVALMQGIREIRAGNLRCRMGDREMAIMGEIGEAFNEMAGALERSDRARKALVEIQIRNNTQWIRETRNRQRSLAQHKERLEERVKARTLILESTNTALRSTIHALERRTLEITHLNRLAESLQHARDMEEAAVLVVRTCQQIFPSDAGVLVFLDAEGRVRTMEGWGRERPDMTSCMGENCPSKRPGGDKLDVCCAGVAGYEDLCIPIQPREGSPARLRIRLLQMADLYGRKQAARRALAASIAGHLSASLTTLYLVDRLRREAVTDPLTGLYNRRYMEETFRREFSRIRREGVPLSVILMDVDDFKAFNDTHGHDIGDAVLKNLAEILKTDVRTEDVACRFGGEEFLLLMPGLSGDAGMKRADFLRRQVEETPLYMEGKSPLKVTLSLGVATYPGHGDSPQELITGADKAMYAAKMAGRNRVFGAEPKQV